MSSALFPLFAQLPLELRHQIWAHALPPPSQTSIINILDAQLYDAADEDGFVTARWNILSVPNRSTPSVLQSCREARELGTGSYYVAHMRGSELTNPSAIDKFTKEQHALTFHHSIVPLPETIPTISSICCSSRDLVILKPHAAHLANTTPSLPSIQVATKLGAPSFRGIRYLAISANDLEYWLGYDDDVDCERLSFYGTKVLFVIQNGSAWGACEKDLEFASSAIVSYLRNIYRKDLEYLCLNYKKKVGVDTGLVVPVDSVEAAVEEINRRESMPQKEQ